MDEWVWGDKIEEDKRTVQGPENKRMRCRESPKSQEARGQETLHEEGWSVMRQLVAHRAGSHGDAHWRFGWVWLCSRQEDLLLTKSSEICLSIYCVIRNLFEGMKANSMLCPMAGTSWEQTARALNQKWVTQINTFIHEESESHQC